MRSWSFRAYQTHKIGVQHLGRSPLDIILGQAILHWARRLTGHRHTDSSALSPIVIAGLPRTGTTFLHRYLHQHGIGTGQTLWEQMFPSPPLRRVLHPYKKMLERISPSRHHRDEIHKTGFDMVETNEASLFFQYLDGFFLYAFFWAFDDDDHRDFFDSRHRDVSERDLSWLVRCWAQEGTRQPLAKLFAIGAQIPRFQEYFPSGKVIYTTRDPCSVIPSTLSLLTSVLATRFDWDRIAEKRKNRYYRRICDALIELMHRFHVDWSTGAIDRSRCLVVSYKLLMKDFSLAMKQICQLLHYNPSSLLQNDIQEQHRQQLQRKSQHRYDLSTYGLDRTEIEERTRFFLPYWRKE